MESNLTGPAFDQDAGPAGVDEVQRQLAELAVEHDLIVLSDEIYARVIYGGQYRSLMGYPGMEERTLIIDGFSKSFAMTGWRLGYAIAPPRIAAALSRLQLISVRDGKLLVVPKSVPAIKAPSE